MVFCNKDVVDSDNVKHAVTILILIDGFLQCIAIYDTDTLRGDVTILILIDGFLQ